MEVYILLIREYRVLRGMTQKELARKAKLRQAYISELERGHPKIKSPTLRVTFRIARALDICPHVLVRYNIGCDYNCFNTCNKNFFK
ncbi:helix-turn-helix domain-containing protein [Clostridium guangxiense]|uniref:helix-turn-helix domain-containing protein n=1 Tax=Clostridium guangxiense TaxID=1662055 RepID=UPI001E3156AE|nr:helix-turn-helix transcriptional regulator [Clostridium guangxiense]MCD2345830.1 helix-turn-helix transcriptional regulator [Clostridium guangxiense]